MSHENVAGFASDAMPAPAGSPDHGLFPGMLITELMMCVGCIAVASGFGVASYLDYIKASRLVEPLAIASSYRVLWVEEFAVAGRAPADSASFDRAPAGAATERAGSDIFVLGSVSGLEALRARGAHRTVSDESEEARAGMNARGAVAGISDGVPMAAVQRTFLPAPAIVELRPALRSADSPVVAWLCDSGPAPAGWSAPAARAPHVPSQYLPSVCRKGWKP